MNDQSPVTKQCETPQQRAEREFNEEITQLSVMLAEASIARHRIEAELKNAKQQEKHILERLEHRTSRGPLVVTEQAQDESPAVVAQVTQSSDDWRKCNLAELQTFKLTKNTYEKLVEAGIETIGQLEDMRAEISLGKAKWPKGIGKAKVTQIEDAVTEWLTKNRDSALFQSAGQPQASPDTQPAAEATAPTGEVPPASDETKPVVEETKSTVDETKSATVVTESPSSNEPAADHPPEEPKKTKKARLPQFADLL